MQEREHLTRQAEIIPGDILDHKITIVGAGAVGGWTALALAKMGFENLTVLDFDVISVENFNSQLYPMKWHNEPTIGRPKVDVLASMIEAFTGIKIEAVNGKYTEGAFRGIVIAAVDSMAVRKALFQNHRAIPFGVTALIDPRMGAEQASLYVVRPAEEKECQAYEKSLYSDEDAVQERCTAKATIYTANLLAGLVVKACKDTLLSPTPLVQVQWNIAANDAVFFNRPTK